MTDTKRRFAIHPGYIWSKNDDQLHYVGVSQLVKLYMLKPDEYIVWDEHLLYKANEYTHLYPRYNGDYGRPE
jgi:hypothetical protein